MRAAFGAVAAGLLLACAAGTAGAQPVWQGPYIGASLGAQWGDVSNSGTQPSGGTLGAFGGYNWQNGGFIFGVEVDAHISNASDR
ncbi:MAG TPA: outer membrane beta-barrel protein, partial [Pseudolabrys sp.]|nr:outer membrane beta-barrel protein [Pseudolabrys sp.]